MLRSKPVVGLLGLVAGFCVAFVAWNGWRLLVGRRTSPASAIEASATAGVRSAAPAESAVPPAAQQGEIAEDEAASAAGPATATPESREELAKLLPEPDLSTTGLTDELPAPAINEAGSSPVGIAGTDDAQIDTVLEQITAEAEAGEPATLQSRFGPNAAPPDEGGDCPPDHPVKGNTNSMIYHMPGQSSYGATRAEVCFADPGSAEAAGFRATRRKSSGSGVAAQDLNA
jgi:hypothetical protein